MCKKKDENGHALVWMWIAGKHVLACVVKGCGHIMKESTKKAEAEKG